MIESAASRIVQTPFVKGALGLVNRLPFPFYRLPVAVNDHRMVARTLDRFLALWFWKYGIFGAAEAGLLGTLCREGMSVLDLGANVGFHTLLFARSVGAGGHVWAFEPDPDNFSTLCANLELNSYGNVTAVQAAVGTASGRGSLYRSPFHCDHRTYSTEKGRQEIPVEMVSIDEFLPTEQRVDLIKIDIQGAEGMALQGMKRTLTTNPGVVILMEFWPEGLRKTGFSPGGVLSELENLGFVLYRIDERTNDVARVRNRENLIGSLAGSGYANLLVVQGGVLPGSDTPLP